MGGRPVHRPPQVLLNALLRHHNDEKESCEVCRRGSLVTGALGGWQELVQLPAGVCVKVVMSCSVCADGGVSLGGWVGCFPMMLFHGIPNLPDGGCTRAGMQRRAIV